MSYFLFKAAFSGLMIALISEIARRNPGFAALVASLPLVSVIGMIWMWRDSADVEKIATHAGSTLWYVLPSMPMFFLMPVLLRSGFGFWTSLLVGCGLTVVLYLALIALAPRLDLSL